MLTLHVLALIGSQTITIGGSEAQVTRQLVSSLNCPVLLRGSLPASTFAKSNYQFDDNSQLRRMVSNRTKLSVSTTSQSPETLIAYHMASSPAELIFNIKSQIPVKFKVISKIEQSTLLFKSESDLPYNSSDIAKLCGIQTPLLPIYDKLPIYISGQFSKASLKESLIKALGANISDKTIEFNILEFKKRLNNLTSNTNKIGANIDWFVAFRYLGTRYVPDNVLHEGYSTPYEKSPVKSVRINMVRDLSFQQLGSHYLNTRWLSPTSNIRQFTLDNFKVEGPYGIQWDPSTGASLVVTSKDPKKYPDLICVNQPALTDPPTHSTEPLQ